MQTSEYRKRWLKFQDTYRNSERTPAPEATPDSEATANSEAMHSSEAMPGSTQFRSDARFRKEHRDSLVFQNKETTVHGQHGTSPPLPGPLPGPYKRTRLFPNKKTKEGQSETSRQTPFSPADRICRARVAFSRNLALDGRKTVPRDAFPDTEQNSRNEAAWAYFNTYLTWPFTDSQLLSWHHFNQIREIRARQRLEGQIRDPWLEYSARNLDSKRTQQGK